MAQRKDAPAGKRDKMSDEETGEADVVRAQQRSGRKKSNLRRGGKKSSDMGSDLIKALGFGVAVYVFVNWCNTTVDIRSTTEDQPIVQVFEQFMPLDEFDAIQECMDGHPLVNPENKGTLFNGTRGFMVKFNREGVKKFHRDKNFRCFVPFFERARLADANAWVMNLLICDKRGSPTDVAVKLHVDNTVGVNYNRLWLPPPKRFLAHEVDVLYARVPSDMDGGRLEVFSYDGDTPPAETPESFETLRAPDEAVDPVENTRIAFRGDAFHRVMGFSSGKTGPEGTRISLVLEQYQLPDKYYPYTFNYKFENKATGGMD